MAASYLSVYLVSFLQKNPIFLRCLLEVNSMLSFAFLVFFVALFLLFFSLIIIRVISFAVFNRRIVRREKTECEQHYLQTNNGKECDPSIPVLGTSEITRKTSEDDPTRLRHPFLLELLPSDSVKWGGGYFDQQGSVGLGLGSETGTTPEERSTVGKRKKKKAKRKKESSSNENGAEEKCGVRENSGTDSMKPGCLCPFTSSSSAMQRRIKLQYDELMKCHEAKKLTLTQVGNFANSLVEARTELQHKADVIKRKFTITKALLSKADRSSFDRLRKQIYKLELEQKRLEEDALVYNWLQQQLKLSPAYQKMLEIGDKMEWKTKSKEMLESTDPDFDDISFEELLAQEKKDAFWQKAGKPRFCSS